MLLLSAAALVRGRRTVAAVTFGLAVLVTPDDTIGRAGPFRGPRRVMRPPGRLGRGSNACVDAWSRCRPPRVAIEWPALDYDGFATASRLQGCNLCVEAPLCAIH